MQKLVFEKAWERTISKQDQHWIETRFEQTKDQNDLFIPLRSARNHQNNLLVTVLIHNTRANPLDLREISLKLFEKDKEITMHTFSEPRLVLEPYTSMPWTFIFPHDLLQKNLAEEHIQVTLADRKEGK